MVGWWCFGKFFEFVWETVVTPCLRVRITFRREKKKEKSIGFHCEGNKSFSLTRGEK